MTTAFQKLLELPAEDLALLRQRARELAKPLVGEEDAAEDVFEILEINSRGQLFGLPLSVVEGIGDLTAIAAVPRAPPLLRGIISFRGEALLAIELSSLLGATNAGLADLRRVIVFSAGGLKAAIVTEKVVSIRSTHATAFSRDRLVQHPFVVGVDKEFVTLLEPGLLIQHAFRSVQGTPSGV